MSTKRGNPEHDTPPKDQRHKRNKKGASADPSPIYCSVCSNIIVEYNADKGVDGDDAMFCEGDCQAWVHRMCVGLNKQTYDAITEEDSPYLCPHCNIGEQTRSIHDLQTSTQLDESLKQMESRLLSSLQEVITSSITSLKTSIESEVKSLHVKVSELTDRVQKLEIERSEPHNSTTNFNSDHTEVQSQPKLTSLPEITSTVMNILNEEKAKEKRKLNIIIHGVQESKSEESQERKVEDIEQVNSLFKKYLEVDVTVDNATRLGKKSNDKPRLLRIITPSEIVKKQIMQSSSKLRKESNPDWVKRIFITYDLTPKQQEENRVLRKKLTELNSAGRIYKIKNGQIVRKENG